MVLTMPEVAVPHRACGVTSRSAAISENMSNTMAYGFSPTRMVRGVKQPTMAARSSASVFRKVLVEGASSGYFSSSLVHPSVNVAMVMKIIFFMACGLKFEIHAYIDGLNLRVIGAAAAGGDLRIPPLPEVVEREQVLARYIKARLLDTQGAGRGAGQRVAQLHVLHAEVGGTAHPEIGMLRVGVLAEGKTREHGIGIVGRPPVFLVFIGRTAQLERGDRIAGEVAVYLAHALQQGRK